MVSENARLRLELKDMRKSMDILVQQVTILTQKITKLTEKVTELSHKQEIPPPKLPRIPKPTRKDNDSRTINVAQYLREKITKYNRQSKGDRYLEFPAHATNRQLNASAKQVIAGLLRKELGASYGLLTWDQVSHSTMQSKAEHVISEAAKRTELQVYAQTENHWAIRALAEGKMKSELRTVMKYKQAECEEEQETRDNTPYRRRAMRGDYIGRKVFIRRSSRLIVNSGQRNTARAASAPAVTPVAVAAAAAASSAAVAAASVLASIPTHVPARAIAPPDASYVATTAPEAVYMGMDDSSSSADESASSENESVDKDYWDESDSTEEEDRYIRARRKSDRRALKRARR